MYKVLARKWRPQSFDHLVGQSHVARTLSNALEADRLAHAYIFAGLRGTGKTTVARILAKCLNCESGPTVAPCNRCAACVEIGESRAIDVLEIDAASRTKVEQTRELLEVVSYAPVRDRYKILIIDEAHMLSKSSFNALLKTLEEPPPNVMFLLATTELQRILPTILSRCQVFEFRRVGAAEVAAHLRRICDDEKIEIADAALDRLARGGEGSVRDSLSLLERAVAFSGTKIADDDVRRMLGSVQASVLADLVAGLADRDAGRMLLLLDGLVDQGHDLVHFWSAAISAVRDLLLLRALPDRRELLSMPAEDADRLARAAEGLSRDDLSRVFQILADLEPGLKSSAQPRFLFEAALIRLATLGAVRPIEDVLGSLGDRAASAAPEPKKKRDADPARPAPPAASRPPLSAPEEGLRPRAPADRAAAAGAIEADLVAAVRAARPMLAAMLDQASALTLAGGTLDVRFPDGMEAIRRQVEARDSLDLLAAEAARLTGSKVRISLAVEGAGTAEDHPATPGQGAPTAGAATPRAAAAPEAPAVPTLPADSAGLLEQARREPGVRKLMDVFGAHVVDIRRLGPADKPTRKRRTAPGPEDAP
jgi:DNA polymerase-3 subunit gamma/tau